MTAAEWEALDEVSRNLMQASLKSQKLMSEAMQKALEGEAEVSVSRALDHEAPVAGPEGLAHVDQGVGQPDRVVLAEGLAAGVACFPCGYRRWAFRRADQ